MACAAALAMSIASCSSSTCYTCTATSLTGVTASICDSKLTYTGVAVGLPAAAGTTNDQIKTALEAGGVFKCVAK